MNIDSLFSLEGKVVLITGGSGHLGSAMSDVLSQLGATLILASRNVQKNKLLKSSLLERYDSPVYDVFLDISDVQLVSQVVEEILVRHKKIDVLINNSYFGAGSKLTTMTEENWLKGIDGSINSVFRMTKTVLNSMIKNKNGKIINIASMYGVVAPDVRIYEDNDFYNPANYGVGKAGIIHFTKYIASVYGKHGITCNSISPGPFPNEQVQNNIKFIESLKAKVPLGRIGCPDDLKGIVALLASDASNYINGANIKVDGGWTIW